MSSNLSRRDFLTLAAGTLAYLPRIASTTGGYLLATAPVTAWAEETVGEGVDPAHVVLIDPDELGIQVLDVASGLALAGAHVTITSFAEGAKAQVMEGDTDASGIWVANVADLSEPDGMAHPIKTYAFYARIEVQKDGYRPFTTALVRAVAGQGLAVSTQPIVAGQPYPRLASFNEFDILYTANEFIRSTANDSACTLELLLENMDPAGSVSAQLYQDESPLGIQGSFAVDQGTLLVHFEGAFLNAASGLLAAGAGFNVHLSYSTGLFSNVEIVVPLNLVVMDAPPEVQAPLYDGEGGGLLTADDKKRSFSIFNRSKVEETGVSFPDNWPVIGGQKLKIWTPECWCGVAVDPFGFIRLSMKTPPLGMKNKYGKAEDQKWGWHPRKDARAQIDKYKETIQEQKDKERAFMGGWDPFWQEGLNPEALTSDQPVKKLGITAMGEVAAILQWKTDGYIPIYSATDLEGIATAHVLGTIDYQYKQQFIAACIPMIFVFGVKFSVDVGVTADITSKSFGDFLANKYDLDLAKTGFSVTLCLVISVSLGAGIDGLLSVSLRAALTITAFIGITMREDESLPPVHFVFSMGFSATVVLQYLCFTNTFTPLPELQKKVSGKDPLYDNWKTSQLQSFTAEPEDRGSLYEFMTNGARIIEADTLASRGEYVMDVALAGMEDTEVFLNESLTSILESSSQTFYTDDDEPYNMTVYTPVTVERMEEIKSQALLAMGKGEEAETSLFSVLQGMSLESGNNLIPVFGASGDAVDAQVELKSFDGRYSFSRPAAGVASLGLFEGVRPSSDIPISQDVFSDPRSKVVSIFGRPCLLRVATVELNSGDARTRLVLQEMPGGGTMGAPTLLDFKLSVGRYPRYEYFDYDFDVTQTTTYDEQGNERCDLHLLVVSGVRDDDDETTLVGAAQGHIFSYVRYSFTDPGNLNQRYAIAMQVTPDKIHATDCPDGWDNHIYLTPQIQLVEQDGEKVCVMSFVDRAGREATGMLNDQSADETRVGVGMFFSKVVDGKRKDEAPVLSVPDLSRLREKMGTMGDLALTSMSLTGLVGGYNTIKFGGDTNHYMLLGVNPSFSTTIQAQGEAVDMSVVGIGRLMRVSDEAIAGVLTDPEETQLDLQEVPGQDYLLTCVNGQLQKVTWGNTDGGDPVPVLEPCGPEGVQIRSFTVDPSGEFIYWPTIADGDAPAKYDENGELLPTEEMHIYRIMACRMRGGVFSKPFQLSEQDSHPLDTLRVLENTRDGISFVSTEVVDAYQAQANIWFTVVPHLRCLSVAYLAPEMGIVHVGDDLTFRIALRNDGNTYLRQATIRLTTSLESDAVLLAEHTLVFSEENTLVSQWNPQGEDGKPTGVESDYALAPGATSLYRMPGFVVPEDAPHDYYIYATVLGGTLAMAPMDGLTAQDEENVQEYLGIGLKTVASGDRVIAGEALAIVDGAAEEVIDIADQRRSDLTIKTNGGGNTDGDTSGGGTSGGTNGGGTSGGGNNRGGSAGGSSSKGSGRRVLPAMGDDSSTLGAAGVAMGAAGAAMVAYAHRREQQERERMNETGE